MPLDGPGFLGTEKDGSGSKDYCKFCYKDGSFTNPGMTLAEMKSLIIDKMTEKNIPASIMDAAVAKLPFLKRWKTKPGIAKKQHIVPSTWLLAEEKHPLEEPPETENIIVAEEDLDKIPSEDPGETPLYEPAEPGEGP
jgi:hypothetical protein